MIYATVLNWEPIQKSMVGPCVQVRRAHAIDKTTETLGCKRIFLTTPWIRLDSTNPLYPQEKENTANKQQHQKA